MKKKLPVWFFVVSFICCVGAIYNGAELVRLATVNRALTDPENIVVNKHSPAPLVFAKAWQLDQTGNSGEAIRLYASLRNAKDPDFRARALYNLGTIYLRDGAKRWHAHGVLDAAHVSTLVELAKESYREALRLEPENWDARYNLEYAWRITPPPKEQAKSDFRGSKSSVFATLPGLPGGGP